MKEMREERKLTQKQMADILGIKPSSLWKIETGKVNPKPTTIERFCQRMLIPRAYFYHRSMTIEDYFMPSRAVNADAELSF